MMARKCSHCGKNGHNARTCSRPRRLVGAGGLRLFGVQLHIASSPMKKSFSMECLSSSSSSSSPSSSSSSSSCSLLSIEETTDKISTGYSSDGLMGREQGRRKGVPWTQEEHRTFLAGLEKLGRGDWRGISRHFVTTRTPTQVASHAQKYFLRQNNLNKKRRSSVFDAVGSRERLAQYIESSRLKVVAPTTSSLNNTSTTNLKYSSSEQVTQVPSGLDPMLTCPVSMSTYPSLVSRSSPLMAEPHDVHRQQPDLELSINCPHEASKSNQIKHPHALFSGGPEWGMWQDGRTSCS